MRLPGAIKFLVDGAGPGYRGISSDGWMALVTGLLFIATISQISCASEGFWRRWVAYAPTGLTREARNFVPKQPCIVWWLSNQAGTPETCPYRSCLCSVRAAEADLVHVTAISGFFERSGDASVSASSLGQVAQIGTHTGLIGQRSHNRTAVAHHHLVWPQNDLDSPAGDIVAPDVYSAWGRAQF